jgi:hypothetical protein
MTISTANFSLIHPPARRATAITDFEILAHLRKGLSPAEITRLAGVDDSGRSGSTAADSFLARVERVLDRAKENRLLSRTPGAAPLSHEERAARRKEVAEFVRSYNHEHGKGGVRAAAKKFGLSLFTIQRACEEHGVPFQSVGPGGVPKVNSYKVLARLIAGESQADIARDLGAHRQSISQIAVHAREAGVFAAVKKVRRREGKKKEKKAS